MSFPGYFGRNWDALVDCLHFWHSHKSDTNDVAVLIDGADELLDVPHLGLLVSVLCQAAWGANYQLDADGDPSGHSPFSMHFVFLLAYTPPAAFAQAAASDDDVVVNLRDRRLGATLNSDGWPLPADTRS